MRVEHSETSYPHVQVNAYAGYGGNQGGGYTDNQGAAGVQASGYGQSGYGQSQPSSGAMQVSPILPPLDPPMTCAIGVCCRIVTFWGRLQRSRCCLQSGYGGQQQAGYGYGQQSGQGGAVAQAAQGLPPDQQARVSQMMAQVGPGTE